MADPNYICKIPACGKPTKAQSLCNSHYRRMLRHGDPLSGSSFRAARGKPAEFVDMAVSSQTDDCIEWPFAKDKNGYGKVGRSGRAHRLVLEASTGPAPSASHEAAHAAEVCHNPACVNPRHLRWATVKENSHDRFLDGTDPRGVRGGNTKLTEADVIAIRRSYQDGESLRVLAQRHAVTYQNVRSIIAGKTWQWLKSEGSTDGEAEGAALRRYLPG